MDSSAPFYNFWVVQSDTFSEQVLAWINDGVEPPDFPELVGLPENRHRAMVEFFHRSPFMRIPRVWRETHPPGMLLWDHYVATELSLGYIYDLLSALYQNYPEHCIPSGAWYFWTGEYIHKGDGSEMFPWRPETLTEYFASGTPDNSRLELTQAPRIFPDGA